MILDITDTASTLLVAVVDRHALPVPIGLTPVSKVQVVYHVKGIVSEIGLEVLETVAILIKVPGISNLTVRFNVLPVFGTRLPEYIKSSIPVVFVPDLTNHAPVHDTSATPVGR